MQTKKPVESIWQAAIDRYYRELEEGGVRVTPIERDLCDVASPNILIDEIQVMTAQESQISIVGSKLITQLEPVLLGLTEFAAIVALSAGMNGRVTALLWGSMRLILRLARPVLPELVALLDELRTALPKARLSELEPPLSEPLEAALLDMYTEILVLYAYIISTFRHPNTNKMRRFWWSPSNFRFQKIISNLRAYSRKVDELADMVRLAKGAHTAETVQAMSGLHKLIIADNGTPCRMIPYGLNLRFYGRSEEIGELRSALDPENGPKTLKVMAICGLGGVGKTQLALHYANTSRDSYDAIAWIHADTETKLIQSLAAFASKLGLTKQEESASDDYRSVQKVKNWLNSSAKAFLLIFDNLEDARILSQIWPASNRGSIIITSRSSAVAAKRAKDIMQLRSFEEYLAVDILYKLTGLPPVNKDDAEAAKEICRCIGGLPLAMVHMSSFIRDRGYSYEEFLALYKKHAERIFGKKQPQVDYDHTLNTVWDWSLEALSPNARVLLDLLSFFDGDSIPERLLIETRAVITEPRLKFLGDEFDFGDAVSELMTKTSMISRLTTSKSLLLHRMVKFAIFIRIPQDKRAMYLDNVVQLLSHAFPNTWDRRGPLQGHGWRFWETCSAVVPHLSSLISLQKEYNLRASNVEMFAELVFRIGMYLMEKEQPTTAKSFFEYGMGLDIDPNSRICAQAYRLLGHISLDLAQPRTGLAAYQKSLAAREELEGPGSPAVAEVLDSIACSYVEIGDVPRALEYLAKANEINLAHFDKPSARTQAIYSIAYLRGNQPDKALEALHLCWALQNKAQEEIEESDYPKHAGDIMLLARIRYALGEKHEGQRLASRSITIRQGLFGAKGPRVADSMFIVARMLQEAGEQLVAAKMYRDIVEMSLEVAEMRGHLARALWFQASVEEGLNNTAESEKLKKEAKEIRAQIQNREALDEDTDEAFMALVEWMLW